MKRWLAIAGLSLAGALASAGASAGGVDIGVSIGIPGVVYGGPIYTPPPVVVAPAPRYYYAQPVYAPRPVYVAPPAVIYRTPGYGKRGGHGHHRHWDRGHRGPPHRHHR